jgi:beta-glucosidase
MILLLKRLCSIVREIGQASTVLLKNENGTLPITAPSTIAVVGNGAGPAANGPNGFVDRGGNDGVLAQGTILDVSILF